MTEIHIFDNKKQEIESLINKGIISENIIENITKMTFEQMEEYGNSNDEFNRILFDIYVNPYLLCSDKPILDIDIIGKLLVKRFNMEISELNFLINSFEIDEKKFNDNVDLLYFLYFESSTTGKKIKRYYEEEIVHRSDCSKKLMKI